MSFEYGTEIVTTSTGEVNVEYYRRQAASLRSQEFCSIAKSVIKSLSKIFAVPAELYHEPSVYLSQVKHLSNNHAPNGYN
jgi:hypothetical protein